MTQVTNIHASLKYYRTFLLVLNISALLFVCSISHSASISSNDSESNSSTCINCHQNQHQKWRQSDHAMAMALPDSSTVSANFNNVKVELYAQKAHFFMENGAYKVNVTDSPLTTAKATGKQETFTIKYTFGHYPLQQYLVETSKGRLQVLPFAWDARPINEGGQRWYHNYSDDNVGADDRLHWRQPLQNYNGMCADCHSDELKRNYNSAENTFDTKFSGINVGCVSCHGNMPEHDKVAPLSTVEKQQQNSLNWQFSEQADTAIWHGDKRDNAFMDTCFACHALRSPLNDGFSANGKFLDQFSPSLVVPPLYYNDGQIKEEVYVYGSFLQSKMYKAGVNCLDCHDPHTMKVKVEGNGLCLQCHKATKFNVVSHHKHPLDSAGAQCVNCHMTDKIYMGVDNRRDHSFKVPRPHLSDKYDTPNACTTCHQEKSNEWASKAIIDWYGKPAELSDNASNLVRLRHGENIGLRAHLAIANDKSINEIDRASAIALLSQTNDSISLNNLAPFVKSSHDLIRLASARIYTLVAPEQRPQIYKHLLQDKLRSVRIAAAQALVGIPLSKQNLPFFNAAFAELSNANDTNAWRGEGRINQGNNALLSQDNVNAELAYKASIDIDPYFASAYVNLADLYRAKMREDLVAKVLVNGLSKLPASAEITYAKGLHLVRLQKVGDSIEYFKKAMVLSPQNPQYAYTYTLALDGNNQTVFALKELKRLIPNYKNKQSLKELGLFFAKKLNDENSYRWFMSLN